MSAKKQTPRNPARPRSDFQRLSRRFMSGLLRSLFFINAFPRYKRAGFVLPTTVLLLLVMTLTVGALSFRTASRTQSTFLAREQQVVDNVAAPAADRAKSKLEYLFGRDSRFPGSSTPSSDTLAALLGDVTNTALGVAKLDTDPYTFPGETRIDINNDGNLDNAWSFNFDLNGDGTQDKDEIVAYSILMDDAVDNNSTPTPGDRSDDIKIEDELSQTKANALVTRNGPINTDESLSACGTSREPDQGWFQVSTGEVEKNFQITAFVSNGKTTGRANSAFELQQVRRARKGNSWGAWFKYDIEVSPGPKLLWNGAMHSDGSLFANQGFQGLMISSHNSCLYTKESSAVTLAEIDYDENEVIAPTAGDFQGQLVVGTPGQGEVKIKGGNDGVKPDIHIFDNPGTIPRINKNNKTKLTVFIDSIEPPIAEDNGNNNKNIKPSDISLDPVALFTRNISQHRVTTSWKRDETHAGTNKPSWENNLYRIGERVINRNQRPPYLDDFYRADGRYGPRPSYGTINWVEDSDDGAGGSTSNDKELGDLILNSDPKGDSLINETAGLDGYWERQAKTHGLRVVVGQRLELGNAFGWQGDNDPLYSPNIHGLSNKQRQRRTLRDNLASVQGMVVYHYESGEPDGTGGTKNLGGFPLACVASTVHPGTYETLVKSRDFTKETFKNASNTDVDLFSDFFTGKGTNGWEYDFPKTFKPTASGTGESFGTALGTSKPLGIGLRNLAHLAGDPKGGSPSFIPVQDTHTHPYRNMAMWGDYSILRRIFDNLLDNTSGWNPTVNAMSERYEALSPADKASLHSAACTMGLLGKQSMNADEIHWINTLSSPSLYFGPDANNIRNNLNNLVGIKIVEGLGMQGGQPKTGSWAESNCVESSPGSKQWDCTGTSGTPVFPPSKEETIKAASLTDPKALRFIELLAFTSQVHRDRLYGSASPSSSYTPLEILGDTTTKYKVNLSNECIPGASANLDGLYGTPFAYNDVNRTKMLGFAMVCSSKPKYPTLHYIFPITNHAHTMLGSSVDGYIYDDKSTTSTTDDTGVNAGFTYKVVGDDNANGVEDSGEQGMSAIAFEPRTTWKLPKNDTGTASSGTLNPETMQIIDTDGTLLDVALLDKVLYNGREGMAVRVLDLDLARLTQTTNPDGSDYWVSDARESVSGIVYAAREDAVREDAIVRPASGSWTDCDELTEVATTLGSDKVDDACKMRVGRITSGVPDQTDPPLSRRKDSSFVGISPKPIIFAPDPDRRPYGFRLNADIGTNKGDLSFDTKRVWGLSFVTDNATYVKGNFNPHTTDGNDTLEEFKSPQTLFDHPNLDFYSGRTKDKINTGEFAVNGTDRWRVAEILADAVTILSDTFVDGAVDEGFIRDRKEKSSKFGNSFTSFHNQERPLKAVMSGGSMNYNNATAHADETGWLREDGLSDSSSPIRVGRNGESETSSGTVFDELNGDFLLREDITESMIREQMMRVAEISGKPKRVNATMISGITPSRHLQGYGGLHNFPRFLEVWDTKNSSGNNVSTKLFIQGAFLQLNFSTASTGPFDADSWDPSDNGASGSIINYYKPPERKWGYDVALQYAPAGPIAQRFVTVEKPRSEHYREIPIDDPYVKSLRCAKLPDGATQVFADESCS